MSRKLVPLHDHVLVRPKGGEERSNGGIVLPDLAKGPQSSGEVLAVGPGRWQAGHLCETQVRVGDVVFFPEGAASKIEVDGEKYLVINESDIYAKHTLNAKESVPTRFHYRPQRAPAHIGEDVDGAK